MFWYVNNSMALFFQTPLISFLIGCQMRNWLWLFLIDLQRIEGHINKQNSISQKHAKLCLWKDATPDYSYLFWNSIALA